MKRFVAFLLICLAVILCEYGIYMLLINVGAPDLVRLAARLLVIPINGVIGYYAAKKRW